MKNLEPMKNYHLAIFRRCLAIFIVGLGISLAVMSLPSQPGPACCTADTCVKEGHHR